MGALHDHGDRERAVGWATGLNLVLLVGQLVVAFTAGSLSLLADSAHQASDVIGLVVAGIALRLAARPASETFSYGLRRAEVIGAQANAGLLLASAAVILVEAARRLGDEPEITAVPVIVLAVIGLAVNGGSAWWLGRTAGDSLNMRAATIHLLADAAGSAGVLVAGLAVLWADAVWVDTAVSVAIALAVGWHGVRLVAQTTSILLEATPGRVDVAEVTTSILAVDRVRAVHHLHVWALDSESAALTAHVEIDTSSLHIGQAVGKAVRETLLDLHRIEHVTLELECHPCDEPAPH